MTKVGAGRQAVAGSSSWDVVDRNSSMRAMTEGQAGRLAGRQTGGCRGQHRCWAETHTWHGSTLAGPPAARVGEGRQYECTRAYTSTLKAYPSTRSTLQYRRVQYSLLQQGKHQHSIVPQQYSGGKSAKVQGAAETAASGQEVASSHFMGHRQRPPPPSPSLVALLNLRADLPPIPPSSLC